MFKDSAYLHTIYSICGGAHRPDEMVRDDVGPASSTWGGHRPSCWLLRAMRLALSLTPVDLQYSSQYVSLTALLLLQFKNNALSTVFYGTLFAVGTWELCCRVCTVKSKVRRSEARVNAALA